MKGYLFKNNVIILQRELTSLDLFVKKFLDILQKYSGYLIVSGYVSICSGRTRATEDVDIIVPVLQKDAFRRLFNDLINNGFWCYQGDDYENVFEYINSLAGIRFAQKDELFPNIEFIPFNRTKKLKYFEFNNPQIAEINGFSFKIPPIEFEILYKELILKGKKDVEDAKHLRIFYKDILRKERFDKYQRIIESEL